MIRAREASLAGTYQIKYIIAEQGCIFEKFVFEYEFLAKIFNFGPKLKIFEKFSKIFKMKIFGQIFGQNFSDFGDFLKKITKKRFIALG